MDKRFFLILGFLISMFFSSFAEETPPAFLNFNMKAHWIFENEINNFSSQPFTGVDPLLFHGASLGFPMAKLFGGDYYFGINATGCYENNSAAGGDDFYGCAIGGIWNELIWPIGAGFSGGFHLGLPCGLVMTSLNGNADIGGIIGLEPALSLYYRIGKFQFQCMPGWFFLFENEIGKKFIPNGPELTLSGGILF